jgi:hypothetical protein
MALASAMLSAITYVIDGNKMPPCHQLQETPVSHSRLAFSSLVTGALLAASVCAMAQGNDGEPTTQVFSQGFSGGPDAEKDDGGSAPRGPKEDPILDPRDLNGLWKPGVTPRKRPLSSLDDVFLLEDPPLRPAAIALVEQYRSIRASGKLPALSTHACRSPSLYTTLFPAFVIAIVQTKDNVFITFEQPRLVRKIRLHGSHPSESHRTYRGDSVGRWEGNTLVVDTIGLNGLGELDISGAPTSRHAHMIERYTKSSDGRSIRLLITIEDPEYLLQPLVVERRWVLSNGVQQGEFDCEENPRADMAGEQSVYLEKLYEPPCVRVEGQGAEPSRVICQPQRTR